MNARNKNDQLTFESSLEFTEDNESKIFTSNEATSRLWAVRVLPDIPAVDKSFDYSVPEAWIEWSECLLMEGR